MHALLLVLIALAVGCATPASAPKSIDQRPLEVESLSQGDIMEAIDFVKADLGRCAQLQHDMNPGLTGKVILRWTIQTSGSVTDVSVITEEFKTSHFATCAAEVVKGLKFPRQRVAGDPVIFPMKF